MLKLAWRNIWRNRRRTLINTGIILFAVCISGMVRSMQLGVYDNLVRNLVAFHYGYAQVQPRDTSPDSGVPLLDFAFPAGDPALSGKFPHVRTLAPRVESAALAAGKEFSRGALVTGVDPGKENDLTGLAGRITQGEMMRDSSGALLSEGLAHLLRLQPGDTLALIGQGYQGQPASGLFRVDGLVHFGSPDLDKQMVYLTLRGAQWLFRLDDRITCMTVMPHHPEDAASAATELSAALNPQQYQVKTWEELIPEIRQAIAADNASALIMVGILYVIIALGILGTFLMTALERRYEFGVMISTGMSKWRLCGMVLLEAVLLAAPGVLAGMVVTAALMAWFHAHPLPLGEEMAAGVQQFGVEPVIQFSSDISILWAQAAIVLCMTLLLSFFPLRFILRLDPVKAVRQG